MVSSSFYKKSLVPCRYSRDSIHDPVFSFFINPIRIWLQWRRVFESVDFCRLSAHILFFLIFKSDLNIISIYNEDIRIGQNLLRFDVDSKCSPFWFISSGSRFSQQQDRFVFISSRFVQYPIQPVLFTVRAFFLSLKSILRTDSFRQIKTNKESFEFGKCTRLQIWRFATHKSRCEHTQTKLPDTAIHLQWVS